MIASPNGAGKTTSALDLLPNLLNCEEYMILKTAVDIRIIAQHIDSSG
jgi:hypothetical protein